MNNEKKPILIGMIKPKDDDVKKEDQPIKDSFPETSVIDPSKNPYIHEGHALGKYEDEKMILFLRPYVKSVYGVYQIVVSVEVFPKNEPVLSFSQFNKPAIEFMRNIFKKLLKKPVIETNIKPKKLFAWSEKESDFLSVLNDTSEKKEGSDE